jgi:hypothetical protein
MVKPDMLEGFNDDEIREIKLLADAVLKRRDDARKAEAIEEARERLAQAGLTFADVARVKTRAAKGPSYKGGHTYQHPANRGLMWNAKGQKPKWLRELESSGGTAVELAANDNAIPAVKRTA